MRFRFRPRYPELAMGAIALGVGAALAGLLASGSAAIALVVLGVGATSLGGLYLGSPAWRLVVVVDDQALEVLAGTESRFRLPWNDVVRVVASPTTASCFVDGGMPARSLLVPGVGAPAPYDIENRAELVAMILARIPEDRVSVVELLESAVGTTLEPGVR